MSCPLAALIDTVGVWALNLGNLKDPATGGVYGWATGDTIFISVQAGIHGEYGDTTIVSGVSPQYCGMVASGCAPPFVDLEVGSPLAVRATPNPFHANTMIEYRMAQSAHVQLDVVNPAGQRVAMLVDGRRAAGEHRTRWMPQGLASGIYFLRLRAGDEVRTGRVHLLR